MLSKYNAQFAGFAIMKGTLKFNSGVFNTQGPNTDGLRKMSSEEEKLLKNVLSLWSSKGHQSGVTITVEESHKADGNLHFDD